MLKVLNYDPATSLINAFIRERITRYYQLIFGFQNLYDSYNDQISSKRTADAYIFISGSIGPTGGIYFTSSPLFLDINVVSNNTSRFIQLT